MSTWAIITYTFVAVALFSYIIYFIVITVGGIFDLIFLFKALKAELLDPTDDGRARISATADDEKHR